MPVLTRIRALALLAAMTAVSACSDDKKAVQLPTAPMVVAPTAVSAYLAVSNANPGVGSSVTVWVKARRGSAVGPIGSFTIRLAFDSTRLRFVESGQSAHGMVMANPAKNGIVLAAGASAEGFANDELLAAKFNVLGANALGSLTLNVTELNTVGFQDQRANTSIARGLYRAPTR
ncbi:MAG TPA: hypothetical protein VKH19_18570 [Gemmatimonadaceae bacterium]|nr:hypothetical protein [Gemmatimonadaceae bacterium]